eukprot:COSAG01_NODE_433_length_17113_cov_23.009757_5_plen_81_part_00
MTTLFAPYFEPWAEDAADFEGLGSYSWNQDAYNASRANALGFKTNWDLSGTWMPYDGLFLPCEYGRVRVEIMGSFMIRID